MSVGTDSLHGEGIQRLYALGAGNRFPTGKGTVRSEEVIDRYVADVARRVGRMPRSLDVVMPRAADDDGLWVEEVLGSYQHGGQPVGSPL